MQRPVNSDHAWSRRAVGTVLDPPRQSMHTGGTWLACINHKSFSIPTPISFAPRIKETKPICGLCSHSVDTEFQRARACFFMGYDSVLPGKGQPPAVHLLPLLLWPQASTQALPPRHWYLPALPLNQLTCKAHR